MKSSVFIATSLDGFIARLDGAIDWLPEDAEPHGWEEFMETVDTVVFGRKTFETVLSFGGTWPYKKPVVVLSSTMPASRLPNGADCELMSGSPHEIVKHLAQRGRTHLYIDGGITIQRFLNAGLIQEVTITRIPVLLGSGIPLFGHISHDIHFEHLLTRSFSKSGLVQSKYMLKITETGQL